MKKIDKKTLSKSTSKKTITAHVIKYDPYSSFVMGHKIITVSDGCTYFFNAQHKFLQLSTAERAYFDFLCEKMNSRNKVSFNSTNRKAFMEFCKEVTSDKFVRGEKTLLNAEKKFLKLHLAFKDEYGKLYYINPKHVFKGTYEERKKLIYHIVKLASEGKLPLEVIMDKPMSVFEPTDEMLEIANDLQKELNDFLNDELGKELGVDSR